MTDDTSTLRDATAPRIRVPTSGPPTRPASGRRGPRRWLKWTGALALVVLVLVGVTLADAWSAFGGRPEGARLERMRRSPQYADGRFVNGLPTLPSREPEAASEESEGSLWEFFVGGSEARRPTRPVPVVPRSAADFAGPPPDLRVTWFGHSTLLVEIDGARVLVDPVWSERASPFSFVGVPRFYAPPLALADLPALDAVVVSHDHYDHLDEGTVRALAERAPVFVVPLGVGAHLEAWGVAPERVVELDWWERLDVGGVEVVSTPARHFSGRSLTDRDATLWSGWALLGDEHRVFYSGDTAMTPEFDEVGARLGPFDLTLIESGAYDASWADVHLGPEQAVQAHQMVRGGLMVPVHWGLFDLALHGWTEPAERVRAAARAAGIPVAFPRPGESVTLDRVPTAPWWPDLPWETAAEAPVVSSGLDPADLPPLPR